jgi:hypothetical protein
MKIESDKRCAVVFADRGLGLPGAAASGDEADSFGELKNGL